MDKKDSLEFDLDNDNEDSKREEFQKVDSNLLSQ